MTRAPRIVLHNSDTSALAGRLRATAPDAEIRECNSYADLPALVDSFCPNAVYTVRFDGTPGYPRDALFGDDGPEWVANGGVGTDHFGTWDPRRTTVTNAAGVAADMMAEYIIGSFLHFSLDIPGLQRDKIARIWNARTVIPLSGKTLLILGLGNTGQALAKRAKAFGMAVIGTRARPSDMHGIDEVHAASDLHRLLPRADFVAVCTPLVPATHGMLGTTEFTLMKPTAILADVSRGGVIDQSALCAALVSGQIAAAALDVFETEPLPASDPLWNVENLIISPHCSSVYDGWEAASFDLFLHNLTLWRKGEALINVVDPARGY